MRTRGWFAVSLLVLLVALLLVLWARSGLEEPGEETADSRGLPGAASTLPATGPSEATGPASTASSPEDRPEGAGAPVADAPAEVQPTPGDEAAPASTTPDPSSVPPAVRRNPRDPPPPDPRSRPLGGDRPPFGPSGHWSKFPPEIPSGRASVAVVVIDRDDRPVRGADVLLGPPDVAGETAVSYAHLRKLGQTDADGRVTAERLPEGSAAIAGNLNGLLNGPRGLDATGAAVVVLEAGRTTKVTVRLPLALADMGTLRGLVRGADGKPARAQVFCGFLRVSTDADGRFEIGLLPAGEHGLSIQAGSHRPWSEPVVIEAGKTTEMTAELEYAETGDVVLRGSVRGPAGEPVSGATVYVIATSGRGSGTVRSAQTGEDGRYEMESLPDRLYETAVRIQANRTGYRAVNVTFEKGLTGNSVDLVLPVRMVRLKLTVLDAATAAPQTRCRFEAWTADAERPAASFATRGPEGVYEAWIEAGAYEFLVEAPDHEALRAAVEVPAGEEFGYTAKLRGTGDEASVEISLTVVVTAVATGEPVPQAKIELLPPSGGSAVAAFEGRRADGRYRLAAASGEWRLRVSAPELSADEQVIRLEPAKPEVEVEVALR